MLPTNFDL